MLCNDDDDDNNSDISVEMLVQRQLKNVDKKMKHDDISNQFHHSDVWRLRYGTVVCIFLRSVHTISLQNMFCSLFLSLLEGADMWWGQ